MSRAELWEKVRDHMSWSPVKTDRWFETPNPMLGGMSPNEMYELRPEKLISFVEGQIYLNTAPEGIK